MNKLKLIQLPMLILWITLCMCTSQEAGGVPDGIIPIDNLSRDNPNHKRIFEWLDNYRQKISEMASYQSRDQTESSKLDLVNPQSYSSINDAIKLASNQPQQAVDEKTLPKNFEDILRVSLQQENEKQALHKRALGDLIPAAFNQPQQQNSQNQQAAPAPMQIPQLPPSPQPDLHAIYGQRSPEDRQSQIEKLDPFIQEHIRKLAEQSLSDGRTVLVEVKGDDTSDKSILDQLRPILHDPSVLDQLRPRLQESQSLLTNQNNPASYVPYVVEHKKAELQMDKPLLEQRDRIEKLRNALIEQQLAAYPQGPSPWGQLPAQPQQLLPLNQIQDHQPQQQQNQQPTVWSDPKLQTSNQQTLIQQLEALAVRPLINQYRSPGTPQALPPPPQNAQLIPQQPWNLGKPEAIQPALQNPEPVLLGQRPRQSSSYPQPQHQTSSWQTTSAIDDQDARQLAKRQQDQHESNTYYEQGSISPEEESSRQRQLREELIKNLEEQERKKQELIRIELEHRKMIEEEHRKQEVRDQQDAERIAREKEYQLARQQKNRNRQSNLESTQQASTPKVNSRNIVSDQRWADWATPQAQPQAQAQAQSQSQRQSEPQVQPQPQYQYQPLNQHQNPEIRSKLVDSNRAGPTGPIDVLHTIQAQPPPQPQHTTNQLPNRHQDSGRWAAVETALSQLQQTEKQALTQQTRGPIQVSAAALAQAEQSDAEYIKMLREILMSQLQQTQPQQQESRPNYVPVEAPPTRGQLTTTLPSGQVIDGNDTNWWRSDSSRARTDTNSRQ